MTRGRPEPRVTNQARWIGQQMEIDDGTPDADHPELALQGGPAEASDYGEPRRWNKGQMAITHGEPQPEIDPNGMAESESGPTGRRSNPGGGQRWASRVRHQSVRSGRRSRS